MRRKVDRDRDFEKLQALMPDERRFTLYDRISRAIQAGRGIKLSAADIDELTAMGVYDAISAAVAKQMKDEALRRIAEREGQPPDA